jgi:type II secretory pathway component GspD/PulD (secretin)
LTSNFFGSYVRSDEGAMMVSAGSTTVISDARLNRLICLGADEDIQLIEQYLKVIDKDASIISIETHGSSRVIELKYTKAEEVAEVIRDAYVDRIALTSNQQQQQQQAQAAAKAKSDTKDSDRQQQNMQTSRNREPEMTLAVHEQSNSLVVTAPAPLFAEVERLALSIDERGAMAVEVISYPNAEYLQTVLQNVLTEQTTRAKSGRND